MQIIVRTDGIGKCIEIRRDVGDTKRCEILILSDLISFLMDELKKKL